MKQFTEKIAIEITGSLTSAAQVKATSIELASNTKITAQEVLQVRNIIRLISCDLDCLKQDLGFESRDTHIEGIRNEETLQRAHDESSFNQFIEKKQSSSKKNIFDETEVDKLKSKITALNSENDNLKQNFIEIQS